MSEREFFSTVWDNLVKIITSAVLSLVISLTILLEKNMIIVKRIIGDLEIIVSNEPKIWKWTWWGGRLWASGGLYGYFGIFVFKGIGTVRVYATNRNNLVLVENVKNTKYLVSPDNIDRFMDLLNRSLVT
jgi:hypothetical protein